MKCPQCKHNNEEGLTHCEECEFPFPSKDTNKDLQELLAQIDEEFELEEEEEDEDDFEVTLPDKSTLLPLRLGSLAQIKEIVLGVINNREWDDSNKDTVETLKNRIEPELLEKLMTSEFTKDKAVEQLKGLNFTTEEIEMFQQHVNNIIAEKDFFELLDDFQEEVDSHLENMDQMVFSPQMYEVLKKTVTATRKAFEQYDKTFAEFRVYFLDKNPDHLYTGLEMEEEANLYLSNSFNLLRETMTNMLGF